VVKCPSRTAIGRAEIAAEVREIVCELWELEPFEITPTSVLARYYDGPEPPVEMLANTLELAFGVTIEPSDAATMVNLEKVYQVLEAALRAKRLAA
jgi:acyl carrier protein